MDNAQDLEGYSRDPGFDLKSVRDLGKRKISRQDSGFDCYLGSEIRQNLRTACGIFLPVCREIVMTQKANQPGECKISVERANLHLAFMDSG